MIRAGLTGNIGSGKSVVASLFSLIGVPVYNADEASKKLLKLPEIIDKIESLFGQEIAENGIISNKRLALIVFGNPGALSKLNALLHPLVMHDFNQWILSKMQFPYVIMEAAILFETGYAKEFDRIILVSCPDETAISRVIARDRVSRDQVLARMQHQIKNDDKALKSDFVILNDGSQMLIPQVLSIHEKLVKENH